MSDALETTRNTASSAGTRPVHGIAGYLRQTEAFDDIAYSFDRQKLDFAGDRKRAVEAYTTVAKRARDLTLLGGFILALAAAARVSGEELSAIGWSVATLSPALIFCAKTWQAHGHLTLVNFEARHFADELRVVIARRLWLQRAMRLVPVLERATGADISAGDECADALEKVVTADRKLQSRLATRRYASSDLLDGGWGVMTDALRKSLGAAIIVGTFNSLAFGSVNRAGVAIACGAAASVFAAFRYFVSLSYVQRRASVVTNIALWNKQVDLFADLDKVIRARADALISDYRENVVIDLR